MSDRGYKGRSFAILLNGQRIAAVRGKSVSYSRTPIDRSDEEKTGWRYLDPKADSRSRSISVEGVATINNYSLLQAWHGSTYSDISIRHADGTLEEPDAAFLESLTYSGEHDGHVAFEASFLLTDDPGAAPPPPTPNPVPAITSLDPDSAVAGSDALVLTINGKNFIESSVARVDGTDRTTTYVSSTVVQITLSVGDLENVGTLSITVFNPTPGGGLSNAATFSITEEVTSRVVLAAIAGVLSRIEYSDDGGENRTAATGVSPNQWCALARSSATGRLVGISFDTHNVVYSDDGGETWTTVTGVLPSGINSTGWVSIIYIPEHGRFVACNQGATVAASSGQIAYSDDEGETWTVLSNLLSSARRFRSLAYSSSLDILVVGLSHDASPLIGFAWSDDGGETWTEGTIDDVSNIPSQGNPSIAWSPELELFVAIYGRGSSYTPRLFTSTNGKSWTNRSFIPVLTTSDRLDENCLMWRPAPFSEFFGITTRGTVLRSDDGLTWTAHTPTALSGFTVNDVDYVASLERLVCVGDNIVAYSDDDGETWQNTIPGSSRGYWAVIAIPHEGD